MDRIPARAALVCLGCVGLTSCWVPPGSSKPLRVSTPTLSVPSGVYTHNITVQILCDTEGATIHYTTDGTEPTQASDVYDGTPISVTNHVSGAAPLDPNTGYRPMTTISKVIKAMASADGLHPSGVCTGIYAIDKVQTAFNISYDAPPLAGGDVHKLDIYHPRGLSGTKVVLIPHGGSWFAGDKSECLELGHTFAGYYNYTTITVNYELSAEPWNAKHPALVRDVARAFAWVYRYIANVGGDPNKIYLFGPSAGGYLVSLLATDPQYLAAEGLSIDRIKGVVSMSGVYDLYDLIDTRNNPLGLGALDVAVYTVLVWNTFATGNEAALRTASPSNHVGPLQPPFRLVYAWKDMAGLDLEAIRFHEQIRSLNGPYSDLVVIRETDVPPEVLALNIGGHYGSPYAINTRDWNSRPARIVVDFIEGH